VSTLAEGSKGVFLIMGQFRYGAGLTLEEAKKNFTAHGGKLRKGLTLIKFDSDTEYLGVDQMGRYHYKGNPPELIEVQPGKLVPASR
jgi:hypothetical protein